MKNRTAWLIERSSTLWGTEWFCSGADRWTKDANKAIQFPDKASAEETWSRITGDEDRGFPYTEAGIEWEYSLNVTEHAWISRCDAEVTPYRDALRALVKAVGCCSINCEHLSHNWKTFHGGTGDCPVETTIRKALADAAALLTDEQNGK